MCMCVCVAFITSCAVEVMKSGLERSRERIRNSYKLTRIHCDLYRKIEIKNRYDSKI